MSAMLFESAYWKQAQVLAIGDKGAHLWPGQVSEMYRLPGHCFGSTG